MRRKAKLITFNGKTQTFWEWARETGISRNILYARIRRSCAPERIFAPVQYRQGRKTIPAIRSGYLKPKQSYGNRDSRSSEIFALIQQRPGISTGEIATATKASYAHTRKYAKLLEAEGKIYGVRNGVDNRHPKRWYVSG